MNKYFNTSIDTKIYPDIIKLERNLYAVSFSLMKLLPAYNIITKAKSENKINKDTIVVESSSGTFALGLAQVCSMFGLKLIIVSDPVIDQDLKNRLEDLGTEVQIITKFTKKGGYQKSRLEKVYKLLEENENSFWPSQYDNRYNPDSYGIVGEQINEAVGKVDILVGSVGSGGSMCGISRKLRTFNKELKAVAVDTNNSILFGQEDDKRILRGLGNSIMPGNLDHTIFDEVHWVKSEEAFFNVRELHKKYCLFNGGTSGASYMVAKWKAKMNPNSTIVFIMPDEGYRYLSTIYNDQWLIENNLKISKVNENPVVLDNPSQEIKTWAMFNWNRRTYEEVMKEYVSKERREVVCTV